MTLYAELVWHTGEVKARISLDEERAAVEADSRTKRFLTEELFVAYGGRRLTAEDGEAWMLALRFVFRSGYLAVRYFDELGGERIELSRQEILERVERTFRDRG